MLIREPGHENTHCWHRDHRCHLRPGIVPGRCGCRGDRLEGRVSMVCEKNPRSGSDCDTGLIVYCPAGCIYYGRCPLALDQCRERPPLIEITAEHSVACWKEAR